MTTPKYKPGSRVCLIDDPAITGTIVRDSFVYENSSDVNWDDDSISYTPSKEELRLLAPLELLL